MNQSLEAPFIHFHIPKTAGTSLRAVLIDELGAQNVGYMMPNRQFVKADELPFDTEELDKKRRAARVLGQLNVFSEEIRAINGRRDYDYFTLADLNELDVQVVTGHLVQSDITDRIAHIPRTTILQDPLTRALSHYEHWREARGAMWWHDGTVPYADNVSFEAFASDPMITNFQTRQLGELTFRTIGVVGKLTEFLEEIGLESGITVPHLNPSIRNEVPSMNRSFVREFIDINSADYELYVVAAQRFAS